MAKVGDQVIIKDGSQERIGTVISTSGWVCCVEFPDGTQVLCFLNTNKNQ